jgi:hypothetical protein
MSTSAKILIVENEQEWADYLDLRFRELFKNELDVHATIEIANSGEKALALVQQVKEPYDLVSLDIDLGKSASKGPALTGIRVLEEIKKANAAWMVSILTGVEANKRLGSSIGDEELAREIQEELRAIARENFPPERLLVVEKPGNKLREQDGELMKKLDNRLKQIVHIYKQLSKDRNTFRRVKPKCEIPMVAIIDAEKFLRLAEEEVNRELKKGEKRALDQVPTVINLADCAVIPMGEKNEKFARKHGLLRLQPGSDKKRAESVWVPSELICWQVRISCGEIITVSNEDGLNGRALTTVQWFLRCPCTEMSPGTVLALVDGRISAPPSADQLVPRQRFAVVPESRYEDPHATDISGGTRDEDFEDSYEDEDGRDFDNEDDDEMAVTEKEEDKVQAGVSPGMQRRTEEWDTTEKESSIRLKQLLRKRQAELESASGSQEQSLRQEIDTIKTELKKLRTGAQAPEADFVRQAKKRAINHLRQNGAVDLANHIESCIKPRKGKWLYNPPSEIEWTV